MAAAAVVEAAALTLALPERLRLPEGLGALLALPTQRRPLKWAAEERQARQGLQAELAEQAPMRLTLACLEPAEAAERARLP